MRLEGHRGEPQHTRSSSLCELNPATCPSLPLNPSHPAVCCCSVAPQPTANPYASSFFAAEPAQLSAPAAAGMAERRALSLPPLLTPVRTSAPAKNPGGLAGLGVVLLACLLAGLPSLLCQRAPAPAQRVSATPAFRGSLSSSLPPAHTPACRPGGA